MDAARHNVRTTGRPDGQPMLFAHGFGCDQNMWRFVAPGFEDDFRVVLFDHIGAGRSDASAYDPERYSSLEGYALDVRVPLPAAPAALALDVLVNETVPGRERRRGQLVMSRADREFVYLRGDRHEATRLLRFTHPDV